MYRFPDIFNCDDYIVVVIEISRLPINYSLSSSKKIASYQAGGKTPGRGFRCCDDYILSRTARSGDVHAPRRLVKWGLKACAAFERSPKGQKI